MRARDGAIQTTIYTPAYAHDLALTPRRRNGQSAGGIRRTPTALKTARDERDGRDQPGRGRSPADFDYPPTVLGLRPLRRGSSGG